MNAEAVVTIASLLFGGYHLARALLRRGLEWAPAEGEVAAAPDYGAYLEPEGDTPLSLDEIDHYLNRCPDHIPHLAVYGPSGSGKSTFVLALLQRRTGHLVITTPKNAADDPWGGFPAVRLGFTRDAEGQIEPDWGDIRDAIRAVRQEVMARHADGSRPRTPLTLVVDELTTTINAVGKQAMIAWMIDIWLTARSVNVRLIVMDPTANVEGWGLTGRGDVRDSIGFVRCERDKSAMLGELDDCRRGDGVRLDTAGIPGLARGLLDPARAWVPPARPAESATTPIRVRPELSTPTSAQPTSYEVNLVRAWYEGGETGMRALARRLYAERGGQPPYDGSGGPYYAVRAALQGVSEETLRTAL